MREQDFVKEEKATGAIVCVRERERIHSMRNFIAEAEDKQKHLENIAGFKSNTHKTAIHTNTLYKLR